MTDQTQAPGPLQIAVHAQYVRDFSFESPNAPQIFAPTKAQPSLEVGVNVKTRALEGEAYEVMLFLKVEAKLEEKAAFIAELAYGGVFGLVGLSEEQKKLFMLVEAPRLLFPFARAIIAEAIRDGGFPPVLLQPIDFAALYEQQTEQLEKKPGNDV